MPGMLSQEGWLAAAEVELINQRGVNHTFLTEHTLVGSSPCHRVPPSPRPPSPRLRAPVPVSLFGTWPKLPRVNCKNLSGGFPLYDN